MTKTNEEILNLLDEKIPRDVISLRDGGGGRKLSYLEGWYIIDRLNKVLGHGKWAYKSEATKVAEQITKDRYDKDVYTVCYIARVSLAALVNGETCEYVDYGYGDGTDKAGFGKAHELAVKEAVTDGIKRCAKNLGMSFGLALYDKTQENVEDTPPAAPVAKAPAPMPTNREAVIKLIAETSAVVMAKKKATLDQLLGMLNKYNVSRKEDLTTEQATQFAQELKELLK